MPFSEDVTFDEHGHADTSWHCAGVRVRSCRVMLNLKSFLVFFQLICLAEEVILNSQSHHKQCFLFGKCFTMYGATLWSGGHYICTFY